MNYIQKLQKENKAQEREINALREGLKDLLSYVQSPKFHVDTTVQVGDIITRINEIENSGTYHRENEVVTHE